jgi:nucleoside-diphosphate-sugar epimerase
MTKIFITGAAGFIGGQAFKKIVQAKYAVKAIVLDEEEKQRVEKLYDSLGSDSPLELSIAKGSFEDAYTFQGLFDDVDMIVLCASPIPTIVTTDYAENIVFAARNIILSVLNEAKKCSNVKRVVHISSVTAITGLAPNKSAVFTEMDWSPSKFEDDHSQYTETYAPYFNSKAVSEKAAWEFMEGQDVSFDFVALLPAYVVGRNEHQQEPGSITSSNTLVAALLFGKVNMDLFKCVVHIDDVAQCMLLSLDQKRVPQGRYILDSGDNFLWNEGIEYAKAYNDHFSWNFGDFNTTGPTFDNSKSIKVFDIKYKTYKEAINDFLKQNVPPEY